MDISLGIGMDICSWVKEDVVWLYISEIGWFWTTKDIWSNQTLIGFCGYMNKIILDGLGITIMNQLAKSLFLKEKLLGSPKSKDFLSTNNTY